MSRPHGIILFGANGSGKTTLGRELARILNVKHMDHEDYHFIPSEIPYTVSRPHEECLRLMLADILKYRTFVLSAVTGDFGETIPRFYELAVFLSAPTELRVERVEQRTFNQHGKRIREGGDMYEQHRSFIDFVATRPLNKIEQWAETLACPIIRVDGTMDWKVNAVNIAEQYHKLSAGVPLRSALD